MSWPLVCVRTFSVLLQLCWHTQTGNQFCAGTQQHTGSFPASPVCCLSYSGVCSGVRIRSAAETSVWMNKARSIICAIWGVWSCICQSSSVVVNRSPVSRPMLSPSAHVSCDATGLRRLPWSSRNPNSGRAPTVVNYLNISVMKMDCVSNRLKFQFPKTNRNFRLLHFWIPSQGVGFEFKKLSWSTSGEAAMQPQLCLHCHRKALRCINTALISC